MMKYNLTSQKKAIDILLSVEPGKLSLDGPISPTRLVVCPFRGFAAGVAKICTFVTSRCSGSTNPAADLTLSKVVSPICGVLSELETMRTHIDAKRTV